MKKINETEKSINKPNIKRRKTIGILVDDLRSGYQIGIVNGVLDFVNDRDDVNVLCFEGGGLGTKFEDSEQRNKIYDLANKDNVDGLIILAGAIGTKIGNQKTKIFCKNFKDIPIVTIAMKIKGIPSLLVDNYTGMRELVDHLVKVHNFRHIAFFRKHTNHSEDIARFNAYKDVLKKYHIPYDKSLIVSGDKFYDIPKNGIKLLVDERKIKFDALVAIDDHTALPVIEELQAHNISVPADTAVVGFDDIEDSMFSNPPLTTVKQPLNEQGRLAAEMILEMIIGNKVPSKKYLQTNLKIRRSCGCFSEDLLKATVDNKVLTNKKKLGNPIANRKYEILYDLKNNIDLKIDDDSQRLFEEFLETFFDGLNSESANNFLPKLENTLQKVIKTQKDIVAWQKVLSAMRNYMLPHLMNNNSDLLHAENFWLTSRVCISEICQGLLSQQRIKAEEQAAIIREIGSQLVATFDEQYLRDLLFKKLPEIKIKKCCIALFQSEIMDNSDKNKMIPKYSKILLTYDGPIIREKGDYFPTNRLVPETISSNPNGYSAVVEPLYFGKEQLGFAIFELIPGGGVFYNALSKHISSALKGAAALEQVKNEYNTAKVIAKAITQKSTNDTLKAITVGAQNVLKSDAIVLFVYNSATNKFIHPPTMIGVKYPDRAKTAGEATHKSFVYEMLRRKEPLHIVPDTASDPSFKNSRFQKDEGIRTCVEIQLKVLDQKVGVMFVNFRQYHIFTKNDINDIQLFAHLASVAIYDAQLFYEVNQRRHTYLEALTEAGIVLTSTINMNKILSRITEQAWKLIEHRGKQHSFSFIALKEGNQLRLKSSYPNNKLKNTKRIELNYSVANKFGGIIGRTIKSGKPQLVNDIRSDKDYVRFSRNTRSELAVPIKNEKEIIGVINVEHPDVNTFDKEDQRYLEALAAQAANAIRNAHLFNKLEQITKTYPKISELNIDIDEVIKKIANIAARVLETDIFVLYQYNKKNKQITSPPTIIAKKLFSPNKLKSEVRINRVPYKLIKKGEPHYSAKSQNDKIMTPRRVKNNDINAFCIREEIVSSAGIPLKVGSEIVGIIFINYRKPKIFDKDERNLIQNYASYIAIAIQNVIHFREKENEQHKALQTEKLASIGLVAAITAHSAKNRLQPIQLSVDQMLKDLSNKNFEDQKTLLERINKNVESLESQIESLMDFSKPIYLKKKKALIKKVFNNAFDNMRAMAKEKGIFFTVVFEGELPEVEIDVEKIEDVFYNLFFNSIDATSKGGKITVKFSFNKNILNIIWEDTGKGISKEFWDRMFEIPFTTKDNWGFGFVSSKLIIDKHKGEILLDKSYKNGTRILINI